ncbi:hypothetical protein KAZ57_02385 [Patescibacteria group bacterium]|nr:hypothetical protein [Patescibacteria group bacterium]
MPELVVEGVAAGAGTSETVGDVSALAAGVDTVGVCASVADVSVGVAAGATSSA